MITAKHGAVATDDDRCSDIGRDILLEGGHAVDAAVGAALCLGVVNPGSTGIGGGAFMLVRLENGKAYAYDMREVAPTYAHEDMYHGNETAKFRGPLSIAVPGQVAGLYKAWKQHGRLSWERLVMPAARLAYYGFQIYPYVYWQMQAVEEGIFDDKGLKEIFTKDGFLLEPYSICRNEKLAESLVLIAKNGAQAFYNGPIGMKLVEDVQKAGGNLTMIDLQLYKTKTTKPLSAKILGHEMLTMPPPSSGAAVMLMLNILNEYEGNKSLSGPRNFHRFIEAAKFTFAGRVNLGDPDFVNVSEVVSNMMSIKFAKKLKESIVDNQTFPPEYYGAKWNLSENHGTSHLSVVDKERNAVSMTISINYHFGAQMMSPSTGIVLNNHMDDFSIPGIPGNESAGIPPPAPANFIRAGKRPLSAMSPSIFVKDRKLRAVVGASGGPKIIPTIAAVLLNYFSGKMDPLASVAAPRCYHQLIPNNLTYENEITPLATWIAVPAATLSGLKKKGHVLQQVESVIWGGLSQFIVREGNILKAASDPRKGGFPAGVGVVRDEDAYISMKTADASKGESM